MIAVLQQALTRESTSDAIWVGRWAQSHIPASARIAYDYFAYVPAAFQDVWPTWGGSIRWLQEIDPDVVIVNHLAAARYFADRNVGEYYQCLSTRNCGFEPIIKRGEIIVYARRERLAVA